MFLKEWEHERSELFERPGNAADVRGELGGLEPLGIEAVFAKEILQPMGRALPFVPSDHQTRPVACSTYRHMVWPNDDCRHDGCRSVTIFSVSSSPKVLETNFSEFAARNWRSRRRRRS